MAGDHDVDRCLPDGPLCRCRTRDVERAREVGRGSARAHQGHVPNPIRILSISSAICPPAGSRKLAVSVRKRCAGRRLHGLPELGLSRRRSQPRLSVRTGIAPLIVAIVSTALLGEQISEAGKIAVILIALGISSLALTRGAAGLREPRPIYLSFIAGGFVGAYTITDALGARSAGSPNGYMVWVTLLYAVLVAGCFWFPARWARPSIAAP